MPGIRRGISATQLARDYAVSLNDFTDEVIRLLSRLQETDAAGHAARRREICAAVSAAMTSALDATTLTEDERTKLNPLLHEVLMPYWTKHCAQNGETAAWIAERSQHYLQGRVAGSQTRTAVNIVNSLLDALGVTAERKVDVAHTLAPSFAHRMVADIHRINDIRSRYGIELSLMAALCTMLQMLMSYDTVLRALRLV